MAESAELTNFPVLTGAKRHSHADAGTTRCSPWSPALLIANQVSSIHVENTSTVFFIRHRLLLEFIKKTCENDPFQTQIFRLLSSTSCKLMIRFWQTTNCLLSITAHTECTTTSAHCYCSYLPFTINLPSVRGGHLKGETAAFLTFFFCDYLELRSDKY